MLSPAERGALQEIARRIEAGHTYSVDDLRTRLSPEHFALLQAIYEPLSKRDLEIKRDARENGSLPEMPPPVYLYRQNWGTIAKEHKSVLARLVANRKKLAALEAQVERDEKQVENYRQSAWLDHAKLTDEEKLWLFPSSSKDWPPQVNPDVPLAVLTGGADPANIAATKKLIKRLLEEDEA